MTGPVESTGKAGRLLRLSRRRVSARPFHWAAAVLLVLLGVTAGASLYTANVARDHARDRVDRDAELAVRTLDRRLVAYGEVLVALRGLFEIDPQPSRARFAQFVNSLQLDERYPGVRVVSFARAVDAADVDALTREVRADRTARAAGYPPFVVTPRAGQTRLVVLSHLEPMLGNEKAFGFNLLGDTARARAIEITQSTGRPAATAPTLLVQDTEKRPAFVFMLAVRNVGGPLTSARTGRLQGVVTAAFGVEDLIDAILADRTREAEFEVFDVGESAAPAHARPSRANAIYDRDRSLQALSDGGPRHALIAIDVGGRRWLVYYAPRGAQAATPGASVPWIVGVVGTLASLLAGWLLLTIGRGRARALALARRMTRDLERSERQTRQILEAAHEAFVAIDAGGEITDWNPQAQALFGWSREEAVGREFAATILAEDDRDVHSRGMESFMQTGRGPTIGRLLELTALHRDGRMFPIEFTISVVETEDGYAFSAFLRDISDRRRTGELLERRRRQLVDAQAVGGVGSWEWDVVADTIEWSDELCRIFGVEPGAQRSFEEFLGLIHPEDRARTQDTVQRAFTSGRPYSFEHRIIRPDGAVRDIHGRGEVIADEAGAIVRVLGTGQDITERKAADEARAHLAAIVDFSEDAIVAKTLDGRIVSWNHGAQELFGYSAEEAIGAPIAMLVPPDRADELSEILARIQRGERIEPLETTRVAKDGRAIEVSLRISLIFDAAGAVTGASSITRDITVQKLAEAQLRSSSRYFELSRDLTVTTGFDGYFKSVNPAVARILGWSAEEFLARPFIEMVHPDDRAGTLAEVEKLGDGEATFSFVNRYETRDGGYRWLDWNAIVPPDDEVIYASARDITERTLMEQALREAEQRFRTAFDGAPIGVCLMSLDAPDAGRLLQANPALAELLGRSVEDLSGVPVSSLTHPEDHTEIYAGLGRLADGASSHVDLEKRFMHRDGHPVWALISAAALPAADGQPAVAVTHVMDISDRKRFEGQLQHLADHDALTGLFNRRRFGEELERALKRARRFGEDGAVLFLDLDGFKFVNDTLGHAAGDELITRVASLLAATLRETDTLARVGGDEFAVLLARSDQAAAVLVAGKLLTALRRMGATVRDEQSTRVTSSIGIALFGADDDEITADELVVEADIAMYDAKEAGKDRYAVYERAEGRREFVSIRENWNERLRTAVENDRFVLHAQAITPICSNAGEAFELLLRLPDDHGDLIPPGTFLYYAERFGLIEQIDRWVLRQAVRHLSASHAAGMDLTLTVNVSGKTMGDSALAGYVAGLLAEHPVRARRLVIEITETAAITNIDRARTLAQELQALGCQIALDDFGAGFASFYYLKHLKFDYLKIDGEFIRNLCATPTDQLVVQAVVSIAGGLNARTIAEFVGDDATIELLRRLGVDFGQGFHLGRPAALDVRLPYLARARSAV